jgi:hypothetical protein
MNIWLVRLDWRFARSLGELQILTRASYVMLLVVPILAGIWTAPPWGEPARHPLPQAWVFAFLAALAVTLAQVIYQLRAPEIVRHSTLDEYKIQSSSEFAEHPAMARVDDADNSLERARYQLTWSKFINYYSPAKLIAEAEMKILQGIVENNAFLDKYEREHNVHDQENEKNFYQLMKNLSEKYNWRDIGDYTLREVEYNFERSRFYSRNKDEQTSNAISEPYKPVFRYLMRGDSPLSREQHGMIKVGYASRLLYLEQADRRKCSMLLASMLYAGAILLILIISWNQTLAVLAAAGWLRGGHA